MIFDCDGVLVDSEIIANRMDAEALTDLGYPLTTEESIRRFTGMNSESVRKLIIEESAIKLPDDFSIRQQQYICKAFETELKPLMQETLSKLAKYHFDKCVASSSPRSRVIHSLKLTNQHPFFEEEHIFTSEQVKLGKPAPDLFLWAAHNMRYDPQNCIVIEDSVSGVQAALAAKMNVIGFLGGTHAQYPWYQDKIRSFSIPIAHNAEDLLEMLKVHSLG